MMTFFLLSRSDQALQYLLQYRSTHTTTLFEHERPLHTFKWLLDKRTVIDSTEEDVVDILLHFTKLTIAYF